MGTRAPNDLEGKLHVAALGNAKKEITAKQCETIIPDKNARAAALNFLLSSGMFKLLKDAKGNVLFRAVSKGELTATKDLTAEESLVLSHIQAAHTDGIWKKHLRSKTNLHVTVIDRCIKTLMKKQLIKHVHSVQHPNLKMYMLEHLEPSVALTGGPWYTDNELDTEFIKLLSTACLRFIQDNSLPKQRSRNDSERLIYPLSNAPQYPTAQNVQAFLKKSRITETELSVEHVEMLLNVLVLDGEIEKLPAFGMSMWSSSILNDDDDDGEGNESDDGLKHKRKRRKHDDASSDTEARSSKRKRSKGKSVDRDSDDDTDAKTSKSSRSKRSRRSDDSDSESDEEDRRKRRKKSRAGSDDDSDDDDRGRNSKKSTKKRRHRSSSSSSESESDRRSKSKSKSKTKPMAKKPIKRSPSPPMDNAFSDLLTSGAHVYRAIRQERLNLGWAQSTCAECPSFEFCDVKGPVNPKDCVYFGDWLAEGKVGATADGNGRLPAVANDW